MAEFKVWAPISQSVAVVVEGKETTMERLEDGWWIAEAPAEPGTDYLFQLNGGRCLPDPRSRHQPEGVHGVSRVFDSSEFSWTDGRFQQPPLSSAIVYELHIGTFTPHGTFDSAMDKLANLKRLGVTHVELMPIAEFAGERGWGYDGTFPYAALHSYGGPAGVQRLVDACHDEGLAVLLDVVYNHLGPSGNYLPQFGYYFSDRHKTPWGSAVNFDGPGSDQVRRFFIDSAKMWLRDFHIDGLRVDAIHAIVDTSAYPFLEQLVEEIELLQGQLGRHLTVIAESDLNDPRVVRSRDSGGFGFHAQWSDDFHHALHVTLTGEKRGYYRDFCGLADLATVFQQPYLYGRRFSSFRARSHGRLHFDLEPWRFLAYSQNHDQIGNRAVGERLHQLVGLDRAKIAAAVTIMSPYVPLLFQGEEWAASSPFQYFVDFSDDPALAQAVSEGRRSEFPEFRHSGEIPDPQSEQTFLRSKLRWEELDAAPHKEMLAWYKELVAFRRRILSSIEGAASRCHSHVDEEKQWLLVKQGEMVLAVNFADDLREIELPRSANYQIELASKDGATIAGSKARVPASAVVIAMVAPRSPACHRHARLLRAVATAQQH